MNMTTVAEMTTDDFRQLLSEFYAKPKKRSKMTEEEIKDLAQRLNRKINVPIINETGEEKILIKIILKIDNFLYDNLPNEFYELVRNADRGIDNKEAKRLVRRLTRLANEKIDIPYLPEVAEHFALKFVIGIIVKSARKNKVFKSVREESDKMLIPDSDDDIENLVDD
jgi:sugar-specific transcriptional regulator TrmB